MEWLPSMGCGIAPPSLLSSIRPTTKSAKNLNAFRMQIEHILFVSSVVFLIGCLSGATIFFFSNDTWNDVYFFGLEVILYIDGVNNFLIFCTPYFVKLRPEQDQYCNSGGGGSNCDSDPIDPILRYSTILDSVLLLYKFGTAVGRKTNF